MNLKVKKQFNNLVLLFGSSLFCASLAVAFLLFQYNQKDEIQIKNALVNPDVLANLMTYQIDIVYFDSNQGIWSSDALPIESYKKIYSEIERDKSIKDLPPEEVDLFSDHFSTRLIIQAENKRDAGPIKQGISQISQEVEFTSSGTYRIVTFDDSRPSWVYFRHPEIGNKILNLQ